MVTSLQDIEEYYCSLRTVDGVKMSVYEIWEKGLAFNDSITPAIYNVDYRSHIVQKLVSLTREDAHIFSIGCGNGFVESELLHYGRRVHAIDCNKQAVDLARKKGVDAFIADFFQLQPEYLAETDLVYVDGLIGHLFHPIELLNPILGRLKSFCLKRGTHLVFSNDAPRDAGVHFSLHEKVKNFWHISKEYLQCNLSSYGFEVLESYYFSYLRPISGLRNRTICIVKA